MKKKKYTTTVIQNIFRVLLGLFMVLAAWGHLSLQREEFQAQVPDWIPMSKDLVVVISGIIELLLGLCMMVWYNKRAAVGLTLAIFFVIIFPGNIAQYNNHTDGFGLTTDRARLIRLFFQPVFIVWALWSSGAWSRLKRKFSSTK